MQVLEIKHRLCGPSSTYRTRCLSRSEGELAVLHRLDHPVQVDALRLPAGTLTVGYFWERRPYNIYHWLGPRGASLGCYFNIADRTRIGADRIEWRDLVVDLLYTPDGACRVLDEEELPGDLAVDLHRHILAVRDRLLREAPRLYALCEARSAQLLQSRKRV